MTTAQSVLDRLAVLEGRVRQVLAARQAADPRADDAFRGLYLSDEMIETLLEEPRGPLTGGEPTGPPSHRRSQPAWPAGRRSPAVRAGHRAVADRGGAGRGQPVRTVFRLSQR
nr:hypothetical protein [Fodinicola feengrottensis]